MTSTLKQPHTIPYRYYRAWWRECPECGYRMLDAMPLHVTFHCVNGCRAIMHQAPQGTAPDVESVTEWATCGVDAVCDDHRDA